MGAIMVWMGAILVVLTLEVAVHARIALRAVRRHEVRMVQEVRARSAVEYAVMLLQRDPDRSRDGMTDGWATSSLPEVLEVDVWPADAGVDIEDLERRPPPAVRRALTTSPVTGVPAEGSAVTARWLNVLTADGGAWEDLGLSAVAAEGIQRRIEGGIREITQLLEAEGLTRGERALLTLLIGRGLLDMRSEVFRVRYWEGLGNRDHLHSGIFARYETSDPARTSKIPPAHYEAMLRREPARGGITLISFTRQRIHGRP